MTYFLDFDRTLFDTSAFLRYLIERDNLSGFSSKTEVEMAQTLDSLVASGSVSFSEGELERFLFPDAREFLRRAQGKLVVVTAGNVYLQKAKCENVFATYPSVKLFYTGEERKGPFMKRIENEFPKPWTFVDDKPMELVSVGEAHPETTLYQMCRNGLIPEGSYPALYSFAELP